MNRTFLKHEFLITARSMKNIPFLIFIGVLLLSYCLLILPSEETKESFYPNETLDYLTELEGEQQLRLKKGNTGVVRMSGAAVYAWNDYYYWLDKALLNAYEDRNFTRYLHLRTNALEGGAQEYIQDKELFKESPFPGKDRMHLYEQTMMRYENYMTKEHPITYGLIMEKTGLQGLQKFMLDYGMYFFLFCAIYFSSDVLTRDRKNRSVLQGLPLSWYRQLNLKTFSAFLYANLVIFGMAIVGVLLLAIQFGFGHFNLDVPIMISQQTFTRTDYGVISIAKLLGLISLAMLLLVFLFVRLNIIFSLLVKNEWVVLVLTTIILFSERIYYSRTTRELFGFDVSSFPQTYFDFGKVVTGEKNYLLNIESITAMKGFVVLFTTWAIIEIVLFFISRIVNKRRFYQSS
ncbi:hypothetical protein QWT69_03390 [Sporosarcina oncorhynchi]|uniref:ABC transporter permease n=1 Tax=Sporosarcina oncorhynchi TaxID=3056444 RepID=A0ABZ0L8A6_9BACL|nr:hypothetical protein [Sporosarcina sp. T2O-4]WOV88183.1 hypothetical protein QWT69_03390 [Sporosarcina sp. T2O-4]